MTRRAEIMVCVGADCAQEHGVRLATWRTSPLDTFCDDCADIVGREGAELEAIPGARRVRQMGLHRLHLGRFPG